MWVIEIATGKKKRIKIVDFMAQWLDPENPKYIDVRDLKEKTE